MVFMIITVLGLWRGMISKGETWLTDLKGFSIYYSHEVLRGFTGFKGILKREKGYKDCMLAWTLPRWSGYPLWIVAGRDPLRQQLVNRPSRIVAGSVLKLGLVGRVVGPTRKTSAQLGKKSVQVGKNRSKSEKISQLRKKSAKLGILLTIFIILDIILHFKKLYLIICFKNKNISKN